MSTRPLYSDALYRGNHHVASHATVDRIEPADKGFLRVLTCGSVDDGKSTLIGRLLFETGHIADDVLETLSADSRRHGTVEGGVDFALLVDGLIDERQQGITIDVAYRSFATARRAFVLADTPGHEQYTRNMVTAASTSDLAILLVDARKGLLDQTRRHAVIASLLGLRHVVVAVNKMDLVGYDQGVYAAIDAAFRAFSEPLGFATITTIPISARGGDNLVGRSPHLPWYVGPTVLEALEAVDVDTARANQPFRMAVQWVTRPSADFRGLAGTVSAGHVRVGDRVIVMPDGHVSTVNRIILPQGDGDEAMAGAAVTLTLADEIDVSRGAVLCPPEQRPIVADQFAARLVWMADEPLLPGRQYTMRIGMRTVPTTITTIRHKLDVASLGKFAAEQLALNEIGVCNVSLAEPAVFDAYADNPDTGGFILIDRFTQATVAAGMIDFALRRSSNIHPHATSVDRTARARLMRQKPVVIWFTGLSGSGKSTIADLLERRLYELGRHTTLLDGDNIRHRLNRDLGFTQADRVENIRRVGEVARLMTDAGLIVLCSFISPFEAERRLVRDMLPEGEFLEVYVDTPIEECIKRDPKGLYAKAQSGAIKNFTGFDSPYEAPTAPDIHLKTMGTRPEDLVDRLLETLRARGAID